ncbi:SDR family oxidoreductase [Maritalea porphyrae]|uniref:Short-chain dehydrogenase n=1 Tax=Maritalea porphyrae TaxID=880732 RepID=A0ABQ5UNU9_9HYPH|nr:SDR family oxidoreductase [Maritalea porphyrae]GLQ16268.1 short-chain dehydrogenase [Maritalea porphyrae]
MTKKTILIVGATSDIANATAHQFAKAGYNIVLAARDTADLETNKSDIAVRYETEVTTQQLDILDTKQIEGFAKGLSPLPDIVVCAVGFMGDQVTNELELSSASTVMRTNFEGPSLLLSAFANLFEERGHGTLVGISSVAGNRGRATNYVYGSAKAGFTAFLSGLRNRLASKNVHVLTVLPGFVATRMTEGLDLPEKLTAQPEEVAQAIWRATERKRNVIFVRPIWRLIMLIICAIPEPIFKKLKI